MVETSDFERREVRYRGRVQGVGFRYTTSNVAERYAVVGFVRNLPDGSVELVVEGMAAELDRFLSDLAGTMGGNIHDVAVHRTAATSDFTDFRIRF